MSGTSGRKPGVLFLCTANSARSQIAEALVRSVAGDAVEVLSAGSQPGPRVRPMALQVIEEAGLDASGVFPKGIDDLPYRDFDWVITVCDNARQECPLWLGAAQRLHWSIPDPAAVNGTDEQVHEAFLAARNDLRRRILEWLAQERLVEG